ncbi:MAG: hypothetical protein IJM18_08130 [Clostridia bacterium]|nr:hypothetical protein [Clostridia bacterium]
MKRILSFLPIVLIALTLCGCVFGKYRKNADGTIPEATARRYVHDHIGVDTTGAAAVKAFDTHGGFLGDGETVIGLVLAEGAETSVTENERFRLLPPDEEISAVMYGRNWEGMTLGYQFAKEHGIPLPENGYYYFKNRQEGGGSLIGAYSFNFAYAVFDSDSRTLWYYEIDT